MTIDNFLSFLQQLLTMVDPDDQTSVALAKSSLLTTTALAESSKKIDKITFRAMRLAEDRIDYLIRHKDDYVGVPGEYQNNKIKRQRLAHILMPGC